MHWIRSQVRTTKGRNTIERKNYGLLWSQVWTTTGMNPKEREELLRAVSEVRQRHCDSDELCDECPHVKHCKPKGFTDYTDEELKIAYDDFTKGEHND